MSAEQDQNQIDLQLIRVWLKSSKSVYDVIVEDIGRHELSVENFMILEFLYNKGPHTIQKISQQLAIPSGSITYVVNKLSERDYVKREQSPRDRRSSNVVLTEKGETLFKEIFPKHVEVLSEISSSLNNDEKKQLIDLLKKLGHGTKQME